MLSLAALSGWGCRPTENPATSFRGVVVSPPVEMPDAVLMDVNGEPFNFRQRTAGKVSLIFFGYTNCPDVCPLHAANIAAVLRQMEFADREKIQFIFVTTDPERDTPEHLKGWLANFDPSFIGLADSLSKVNALQASLRLPPARKEVESGATDSTKYLVGHAAQVLAFGLDSYSHVEYPFGIRQEDWAHDLPLLARGVVPVAAPSATSGKVALIPTTDTAGSAPALEVAVAIMPQPVDTTTAALYLVIRNSGGADTLQTVFSPGAASAMIHNTVSGGDMVAGEAMEIPSRGSLKLEPGARHVMLMDLVRRPEPGESFPITLRFARSGDIVLAATVTTYAELQSAFDAAGAR